MPDSTPRPPPLGAHIHLVAIAGVGMATLAAMLKERGYRVSGSDQGVYPPMSDVLAGAGIAVMPGYHAHHLAPAPALVIVGNAVSRANPEVRRLLETSIPYMSFPQAVAEFFLTDKRPLVVAGTHGKTTTTALLAWVLERAGLQPSFLVGGLSRNFGRSYQLGAGEYFAIEGDEYDSAFFDKGPKFLHYRPGAMLLNAVEFDHADIYTDLAHIQSAFRRLLARVPATAPVLLCHDFPAALELAGSYRGESASFGFHPEADWQVRDARDDGSRFTFSTLHHGRECGRFSLPSMGRMNVRNALGVVALADALGLSAEQTAPGLASFRGVVRRQELVGEARGVTIIDDFAHHPTAVAVTIEAVRLRYPQRRLWAVFEPRSNTCRRRIFQRPLTRALAAADRVVIGPVFSKPQDPLAAHDLFSPAELVADLRAAAKPAHQGQSVDHMCAFLTDACRAGDVVLVMSNGAFGGLPRKLLAALEDGTSHPAKREGETFRP